MDYSKTIKKNGLFYYHRKKLLAKWEKENEATAQPGIYTYLYLFFINPYIC